jgi:hypothetical protein
MEEPIAFLSGVEQLLKAKRSLQQELVEAESRNERVETSESTLRHHVVGSRAKLRESRANCKVLQERLDRSQSTAERLKSEKKSLERYLVASWLKVRELQVECEALSDSLGESRGTVEKLQFSETSLQERVRYLETELAALKREGEIELETLKKKGETELATLKREGEMELETLRKKGETELATLKRDAEAEREALKSKGETSVACLEQFLYEGLCQVGTQSWASGSPDFKVVLKDAEGIGPVGSQAKIWLAAIPGLTQASTGGSAQDRALRMFVKGHLLNAEASLDDVHGIVQAMEREESLGLTLALVFGFVRVMLKRTVAAQANVSIARALILLRCLELVYVHVSCARILMALGEMFAQMQEPLKLAVQESCLVAGLVEWLRRLLGGQESVLAECVLVEAQKKRDSIKAEEAELVRHGDCLIIVKDSEETRMSIAFVWPSGFRVASGQGIRFFIGEQVEAVALQKSGEVVRLFGDAVRRTRPRLLTPGSRNGFVDIWEGSPSVN